MDQPFTSTPMSAQGSLHTRMYIVLVGLACLPVLILLQMGRHIWVDGDVLRTQGERQEAAFERLPATRGAILDRTGRALAVNATRYDLAVDPTASGFAQQRTLFFDSLSILLRRPAAHFAERAGSRRYILLARDLSERQRARVAAWEIPGVILEANIQRRYHYHRTAGHLLGHVDPDLRGIAGLEIQYDAWLRGVDGRRPLRRSRDGRSLPVPGGPEVPPQHGENIVLTLDLIRQAILEEELKRGIGETRANWGSALAMDPRTGAILAMANMPDYDPNQPARFPDAAQRNRAITDRIEPGSTFKLISAVASLEEGVVTLADTIDTGDGWTVFHGRTLKDTQANGRISYAETLVLSSNVGVSKVANRLDAGAFYQYMRNFGFGQETGVDLPGEVGGILRSPDQWSGLSQPWMSIGYEIDATPLQVLSAYCTLANGGLLMQPYIVQERQSASGRIMWQARPDSIRRVFQRETATDLLPIFERVVTEGTGKRAQVDHLRIAGKTGTAQTASGGDYQRRAYRASFVGLFPVENPVVALLVVLDNPRGGYGGAASAPIFQRIAARWTATFPDVARAMAPIESWPETKDRIVPDVRNLTFAQAAETLTAAGFTVPRTNTAPAARVVTQKPEADERAQLGEKIQLTVQADSLSAIMPDVAGLSLRTALARLRAEGIAVDVRGHGRVVRQQPAAGAPRPQRAVLQGGQK